MGGDGYYMLLFGLAQVVLSQIPGFHEMAGLSFFAAVMSFFYAFVGVGLGVAKVICTCDASPSAQLPYDKFVGI
jgi:hypothetical protein